MGRNILLSVLWNETKMNCCRDFEYSLDDAVYTDKDGKFMIQSGKYGDEITYINNCPFCGRKLLNE